MVRSVLLFLATVSLFLGAVAMAGDGRLVLGKPTDLRVDGSTRSAGGAEKPVRLDLDYGSVIDGARPITIPEDGLRIGGGSQDGIASYPRFELASPAVGELRGSGPTTTLTLDAEVTVTLSQRSKPELYDVVLTAQVPEGARVGALEVYVEGWKRDAPRDSEPTLRAVLPATLE